MERRSSPRFLKFTIALGLGVAVITSTVRAEPGGLKNPFHFQMCTGSGSLTLVVKPPAPVPPATASSPCATAGSAPVSAPLDPAGDASPVVATHPRHRHS